MPIIKQLWVLYNFKLLFKIHIVTHKRKEHKQEKNLPSLNPTIDKIQLQATAWQKCLEIETEHIFLFLDKLGAGLIT